MLQKSPICRVPCRGLNRIAWNFIGSAELMRAPRNFSSRLLLTMRNIILSIITLVFLLSPAAQAREALSVDRDTVIQENFLGFNAVYHGFTYFPESLEMGMTDTLRALELKLVKESGVRMVRSFYRPDWAMGDGVWLKPDWNSVKMRALYAWLADMQKIGVDVALNMGWWFPRDVIWNMDQHLAAYPADLDRYCDWVSQSAEQIIQERGFTNVKYFFMFTEPSDRFGDTPQAKKTWDYYKEVLHAVNKRLVTDGRRDLVKILGPNTPHGTGAVWLDQSVQELNDVIDIYATHTYNLTTYQDWYALAANVRDTVAKTGKPFWIDEYGVQGGDLRKSGHYGTILALANAAFLNAGAQSSQIWLLSDQYYPAPLKHITNRDSFLDGKHSWGLFPWLPESQAVRPGWHAFKMLARLMGPAGTKVLQAKGTADLPIAAVKQEGGSLSVLVVNVSKDTKEVAIDFSNEPLAPLYRYVYSPEGKPFLRVGRDAMPEQLGAGRRSILDAIRPGEVVVYSTREPALAGLDVDSGSQDEEGLENLAVNQKVEASSVDPDWPAANVTDGQRLTAWHSEGRKQGRPEYLIVDLGKSLQVQQVEIFPGYDGVWAEGAVLPQSVQISLSEDNKRWQRISLKDNVVKANAAFIASFPAATARYVRIDSKASRKSPGDGLFRSRLGEVKVFGR